MSVSETPNPVNVETPSSSNETDGTVVMGHNGSLRDFTNMVNTGMFITYSKEKRNVDQV